MAHAASNVGAVRVKSTALLGGKGRDGLLPEAWISS